MNLRYFDILNYSKNITMGTNIVIKKSKKQHQYQPTYLSLI